MGKSALAVPFYISVAWILLISYQMFTQTAVSTLIAYIDSLWPSLGKWLAYKIDLLVFIYTFAWVFMLSSAIPSVILGKRRSTLVQFIFCLALTLTPTLMQDLLKGYNLEPLNNSILNITSLLRNPALALLYLLTPILTMLFIDLRSGKKRFET